MQDLSNLCSIRDYLRWAVSSFNEVGLYYGHGTDNAWDEAVALILHTLHLPHDINQSVLDARLTQQEKEKLQNLIQRRVKERVPVPYLTHEAWFGGLSFYIDERALIPRSPLAELIDNHFQPWIADTQIKHILDLCTGSACIAIACAKTFTDAQIDATDISTDALAVAKMNVLRHCLEDQVHLYQSDLFAALPQKKYEIIISNPPYVNEEEMFNLPAEYKHEPSLGLAAGKEGLDTVIRILQHASSYLSNDGIIVIEVGNSEVALSEKYPNIPFTWLEFQNGDGGVFLLTAKQLVNCQKYLNL